jgi:hypothetical protein
MNSISKYNPNLSVIIFFVVSPSLVQKLTDAPVSLKMIDIFCCRR